jgi:hypothetical protein
MASANVDVGGIAMQALREPNGFPAADEIFAHES